MNFSEGSVEEIKKDVNVRKRRKVFGIISLLIGISLVAVGVRMILPDLLTNRDYRELSDKVKVPADDDDDNDKPSGEDTNDESGDDGLVVDWDVLSEELPNSVGWVKVNNTVIDYPVLQGDDNEYYLYHDAFGRESYSSAFLDYRADPDGIAKIVYGHTHAIEAGFHDLGQADEQWSFDEIGDVHWSTKALGDRVYKPAFALHVLPEFQDIQRFDFSDDLAVYESKIRHMLDEHEARGEWNTTVIGSFDILGVNCIAVEPAATARDGVKYWWRITPEEEAKAHKEASLDSFRTWLRSLYSQSTASSSDADSLIDSSTEMFTLACCSWPWDDHRTLLVCLR